jgi:hypothetical protein
VKDFDIDKWNPTKLFVVANVTEWDQPSTVATGHSIGLRDTG